MNPQYNPEEYPAQTPPQQQPPTYPNGQQQPFTTTQPPGPSQYPQQPAAPQYQVDPYLADPTQPAVTQPTPQQNVFVSEPVVKSKKPLALIIIVGSVILLLAIGGIALYGWQAGWFGGATTEQVTDSPAPAVESTYETPDSVEKEIGSVQEALDGIDDSQLADDTISNEALNQ